MSVKMQRRRRHNRRKRIQTHRREDGQFYATRKIPASATGVFICSCGAIAFTRDPADHMDDIHDRHDYCE